MTSLPQLLGDAERTETGFKSKIPANWLQGRTAYGGISSAVALAGAMAVVSGLACILFGLLRLGFVTELLSKPIRYGYMNGIALTVLISQLPALFGFTVNGSGPLPDLWAVGVALTEGQTHWPSLFLGAGTLAIILLLKGHKQDIHWGRNYPLVLVFEKAGMMNVSISVGTP